MDDPLKMSKTAKSTEYLIKFHTLQTKLRTQDKIKNILNSSVFAAQKNIKCVSIGDPSPEVSTGDPSPEVSTGDPSPDVRCFSPLPSTSNDNITINLNNVRFSEASGINISPVNFHLKEESSDVKDIKVLSEDVEHQLPAVNSENIIECSSGSDDDNTPISIIDLERPRKRSRKRKKNVSSDIIDLLLDDEKTYYSDCEIVDVDQLIAENNAILDRPTEVIQLDDSVSCEPPQLPSVADFIHQTNSSRAPPKKKIHLLSRCASIITSFFQYNLQRPQEEPIIESRNHSFLLDSIVNLIPTITIPNDSENTNSDQLMPTERRRLRNRPNTQRQNVIEYIDLSQNSKPRLSEVVEIEIGIDINSSINAANSANPNPVQSQTPDSVPHGRIISIVDTTPIPAAISPTTDSAANEISTTGRISDCPICLETLIRGNIVSTYCGHIFCTTCMIKVKAARKRCPTCRKTLNGKGFHPIFL